MVLNLFIHMKNSSYKKVASLVELEGQRLRASASDPPETLDRPSSDGLYSHGPHTTISVILNLCLPTNNNALKGV